MFQPSAATDSVPNQFRVLEPFRARDWLRLALVSAACAAIFRYLSGLLGWPVFPGFSGSLLVGPGSAAGIVAAVVAMLACVAIASLLVGHLEFEAGFFTACIGLTALAIRGGTAGALLRSAGKPQVYQVELLETLMLLGLAGLGWQLLSVLSKSSRLPPEAADMHSIAKPTLAIQSVAAVIQAIVTGLIMFLLARSDSHKQVIASVALASLLGSIAAHQTFPVRPSVPFWMGPFLTGIAGYAWAIAAPGHWGIGKPANPLAAATPLHYASVGAAGAILGYWASRQWRATPYDHESPDETL